MSSPLLNRTLGRALAGAFLASGSSATAQTATTAAHKTVAEIVVTASRLDAARASIQPQLGASVYTLNAEAISDLPGGDNLALSQVVLQSPGVAQDSFGQLHVRGEHNGLQFRLNGVILPEGLSVFSQALSPRLADKVQLITGALPAQYGLRTAGIIDITTKGGVFKTGGETSVYGGAHDQIQPSVEYRGGGGTLNYFTSASYLHSGLGVESPDGRSTPLHDKTDQFQGFAYLEDIIDPASRVSLILGASNQRFQIPDRQGLTPSLMFGPADAQPLVVLGQTGFDSAALNESQMEATYYGVATDLHTTERFTGQLSVFARYSTLKFVADPLGDLLFNGIAQSAYKRDVAAGVQAEGVYLAGSAHTLRAGVIAEIDRSTSRTSSLVIPLDAANSQTSDIPIVVADDGANTAKTLSAYLQDEWMLRPDLTLNYGLRLDRFDGFRGEAQLSPRINMVWSPTGGATFHAGYARYFSPPPFELVATRTLARFDRTTAAAPSGLDTTPFAERASYFDIGVSGKIGRRLTLGLDSYFKRSKHLVDEGQFGAPIILTPFNYRDGRQYGVELTAGYMVGRLTTYANFAYARSEGRGIESSQFNFPDTTLAYVSDHFIHLDHDQTFSASAGASYLWRGTRIGGDLIIGSGLRATGADGIPNGDHLPAYAQLNLALSHRFETGPLGGVELSLDMINALDRVYEIRDGTGIGVGAPQYGPRRGVFGGVSKTF